MDGGAANPGGMANRWGVAHWVRGIANRWGGCNQVEGAANWKGGWQSSTPWGGGVANQGVCAVLGALGESLSAGSICTWVCQCLGKQTGGWRDTAGAAYSFRVPAALCSVSWATESSGAGVVLQPGQLQPWHVAQLAVLAICGPNVLGCPVVSL